MSTRKRKPVDVRHPLMREVFERMDQMPRTIEYWSEIAGVGKWIIYRWRRGRSLPSLSSLDAMVGALGGRVVIEWGDKP